MGIMVYSSLWLMQDLYRQPYVNAPLRVDLWECGKGVFGGGGGGASTIEGFRGFRLVFRTSGLGVRIQSALVDTRATLEP